MPQIMTDFRSTIHRVWNFNPGPSTLPLEVLQQAQAELLDYKGTGMSVMEISHRSKEYEEINAAGANLILELLNLSASDYTVMFLQGGASSQFAMIPMNFLHQGKVGVYTDTGVWAARSIKEAKLFGDVKVVASSKEKSYNFIPTSAESIPDNAAYVHLTSNNTIYGTQWHWGAPVGHGTVGHWWPSEANAKGIPVICDMSSDFCSRVLDYSKFDIIYAGAQKNIGPSGVTVAIMRTSLLETCKANNPTMFDYRTHAKNVSLYNTPPVIAVYMVRLTLEWLKRNGGLVKMESVNDQKQKLIHDVIDSRPDMFRGTVEKHSRSWMNINLRMGNEEKETAFLNAAKKNDFIGLKGHRDVGGIRVSLYNAMSLEGTKALAEFMKEWRG